MTAEHFETDLFRDVLAALQVVVSVGKDLRLHNRHQSVLLAQKRVRLHSEQTA